MPQVTRREFVKHTAVAAAALQVASLPQARAASAATGATVPPAVPVRWLDGKAPPSCFGATWGVPWPQGRHAPGTEFALSTAEGTAVPVQSWPLAVWPDGSLKWTAHAVGAGLPAAETFTLEAGRPVTPAQAVTTQVAEDAIEIDTGVMRCRVARRGRTLVEWIRREGKTGLQNGTLVLLRQDRAEPGPDGVLRTETFVGEIDAVAVEQSGPIRAVVKIEGRHAGASGRAWLPFVLRLYFHAGSDALRVMHTFVYDGDENQDFIRGLGLRFAVPMADALHDRHVRFAGEGAGLFAEAVRGLTGLRRDPGAAVTQAQVAGLATPPVETFPATVSRRLDLIPAFGDWTLFQASADSFEIRKRTDAHHVWLRCAHGGRASGLGYVGGPSGGVAFGLRNFWQSHPAQLDVRGATGAAADVTLWLWAPDAPAMDLRFYHDGMGQDTHVKQLEGLEITYEDYEPGFERPYGVARTSEAFLWVLPATPSRERLVELAEAVRTPPLLVCMPGYLESVGVFGGLWRRPDRSTPAKAAIEDQLDWYFDFYAKEADRRRWYGFWHYGDVMHSYDRDRHEWKYDVGGFAWDNSELSTDIWLWYHFLRTGRADVFRFAEAMTRHTGEVDVHHIGPFAPLGSRHNVVHWGCSAKQMRISTAANRRFYFYLTGDERVGDLMREQLRADRTLVTVQPTRKLRSRAGTPAPAPSPDATSALVGFGTDWGSLVAAWLTEWERTGDPAVRAKILASMETIGTQPRGFFSSASQMEFATGRFARVDHDRASASHLSAVFGLFEICAELLAQFDVPVFRRAWLQYCELYNAPAEAQQAALGRGLGSLNLRQGHSRLTAYAARLKDDPALATRAWTEFRQGGGGIASRTTLATTRIEGPAVLNPVDEALWVSTNGVAQWGLAAIQCLALAGDHLPAE